MHAAWGDLITDLVQNGLEAGGTIVSVLMEEEPCRLLLSVTDNGSGMSEEQLQRIMDPFYTDGVKHRRRVGLGLPFLKQLADDTDGHLEVISSLGDGTTVVVEIDPRHVDVPPMEDWCSTLVGLMSFEGSYELRVSRTRCGEGYEISRLAFLDALGDLSTAGALTLAKRCIEKLEQDLIDNEADRLESAS